MRGILFLSLPLLACGRSQIYFPDLPDAAPIAIGNPCGSAALTPGTLIWDAGLPGFVGPLAADSSGNTFFLSATPSADAVNAYQLASLDGCGHLRWTTGAIDAGPYASIASVFVSGADVVVQTLKLDRLDLATGTQLTTVDLQAFGVDAGLGSITNSPGQLGPAVAASDGTVYVPYDTGPMWLLAVAPGSEAITVVGQVPSADTDGSIADLIQDADGQLDLLLNTTLQGPEVVSFSTAGSQLFTSSFDCSSEFLGQLAAGTNFIVEQLGNCTLTLSGAPGISFGGDLTFISGPMVVDAANDIYVVATPGIVSVSATGAQRWSADPALTPTSLALGAGRLYTAGANGFISDPPIPPPLTTLQALDLATGGVAWSTSFAANSRTNGPLIELTTTGTVVLGSGGQVFGVYAGEVTPATDPWPTPRGGSDSRGAVVGQ